MLIKRLRRLVVAVELKSFQEFLSLCKNVLIEFLYDFSRIVFPLTMLLHTRRASLPMEWQKKRGYKTVRLCVQDDLPNRRR